MRSPSSVWRTFEQRALEEMAEHAGVPVINALTDDYHPCQVLADLLTVHESIGDPAGRILAYLGDGANNMSHSYLLGCALAGMHVRVGTPPTHLPRPDVVARARAIAQAQGGSDTWVSMGQESQSEHRTGAASPFDAFRVDEALMTHAAPDAVFLHCLPAYRGHEVSAGVIDGPRSLVWQEAENRLHVQKALLSWLLEQSAGSTS